MKRNTGKKLLVVMIDALSADYYRSERGRLPNLRSLETRGFRVESLHSAMLGTSLPGRTSIITGVPGETSGVYANKIWDPGRRLFRYAAPDDVRVPTLPALARAAGKRVANIGYGMIRPEETDLFKAPWWAGAFVQRARDSAPEAAEESWLRVALHRTGDAFRAACDLAGIPSELPPFDGKSETERALYGLMGDHAMVDWAGVLAASPDAPDLILTEFLVTDTIQHQLGYKSALSHWAVMQADLAVGKILARLREAGVEERWNIAVMSDHGHSPVERSLHPWVIIPGSGYQCEGQILLVAPESDSASAEVARRLLEHGVEPFPDSCVPADVRAHVRLFVAPDGVSFEESGPDVTEPEGPPQSISSHGLRPGLPGDDRFALFAGPDVPRGITAEAEAIRVMPTLAKLLGVDAEGYALPLFQVTP